MVGFKEAVKSCEYLVQDDMVQDRVVTELERSYARVTFEGIANELGKIYCTIGRAKENGGLEWRTGPSGLNYLHSALFCHQWINSLTESFRILLIHSKVCFFLITITKLRMYVER